MAATYPLPDKAVIDQILSLLFDGLDVKPGGTFDKAAAEGAWFGVFVDDSGKTAALCGADANLAAILGAALSMLPPGVAKDAAKSRELTDVMIANLREIMNISTRFVMNDSSPHVKLEQIYPTKSLPASASALLGAPADRREFMLQVPKYGSGVLTVMSA